MRLESVGAVPHVSIVVGDCGEALVRHGLYRFGHRQDAGSLSTLLVGRPMGRYPLGNHSLFLLVQRQLLRPGPKVVIAALAEIGPKATMGFRRDILCKSLISAHVEQHSPVLAGEIAALRRRCGMNEGALRAVTQKRLRQLSAELTLRIAPFSAHRTA